MSQNYRGQTGARNPPATNTPTTLATEIGGMCARVSRESRSMQCLLCEFSFSGSSGYTDYAVPFEDHGMCDGRIIIK
ncbi:hypothetical protein EIP91_003924 [Steccherinum ochraceum]|uniref:Uncharacterized protein n=1 Tax=Steccherinum ochraceum TaxID=92696 RepID=A0A4R0RUL3_9APHY|nr:hypothetical protein EIP91_003924 [Steccherinum ochraceum]